MIGITVNSNKSLVGQGNKGIIKGKGLRMANGVKNVIIQVRRAILASHRISDLEFRTSLSLTLTPTTFGVVMQSPLLVI